MRQHELTRDNGAASTPELFQGKRDHHAHEVSIVLANVDDDAACTAFDKSVARDGRTGGDRERANALLVIEIASLIVRDEPVILVNVKMKACHGQPQVHGDE